MSQKCLINVGLHFEELVLFLWGVGGIEELGWGWHRGTNLPHETAEPLMFLLFSQPPGWRRGLIAVINLIRVTGSHIQNELPR